jgi:hypothetical protein
MEPVVTEDPDFRVERDSGAAVLAMVNGHWDRTVQAGPFEGRQQKISFSAKQLADWTASGSIRWSFHFPGSPPTLSRIEEVKCMTVWGSTAWIGTEMVGPPNEPLIGQERVWQVVDMPNSDPYDNDLIQTSIQPAANCEFAPWLNLLPAKRGEVKVHMPGFTSFTVSESVPLETMAFGDCSGEMVELSGSVHFLYHMTQSANGGYNFRYQSNFQGVSGVGLTTGTSYRAMETFSDAYHSNSLQFNETVHQRVKLVAQGSADDLAVNFTFHITANATGEITAVFDRFSFDCR